MWNRRRDKQRPTFLVPKPGRSCVCSPKSPSRPPRSMIATTWDEREYGLRRRLPKQQAVSVRTGLTAKIDGSITDPGGISRPNFPQALTAFLLFPEVVFAPRDRAAKVFLLTPTTQNVLSTGLHICALRPQATPRRNRCEARGALNKVPRTTALWALG